MANRIIYNAEDVFVGSPEIEKDESFTFIPNHKILKRLSRVQSFSYEISTSHRGVPVIGSDSNVDVVTEGPPQITIDINYMMHGIENEKRLGFHIEEEGLRKENFLKNFIDISRNYDRRNLYLVTNPDMNNVRDTTESFITDISLDKSINDLPLMTDPKSPNYEVMTFQNCYITRYGLDVSVGSIASCNVGMVADNAIFFISGSGIGVPVFNTEDATVIHSGEKFIIPKRFKESDDRELLQALIFRNGDISVDITQHDVVYDDSYTSNFATNDGWTPHRGTVSQTNCPDCNLKYTQNNQNGPHYTYRKQFQIGKKYKLTGKIYIPSTNSQLSKVHVYCHNQAQFALIGNPSNGPDSGFLFMAAGESWNEYLYDQWVDFSIDFTADNEDLMFLGSTSYGGVNDFTYPDSGGDDQFDISDIKIKEAQERISFHNDKIQSVQANLDIDRKDIAYLTHKGFFDKPPSLPINGTVDINYLADIGVSGNYFKNFKEKENYDITLSFKKDNNIIIKQKYLGGTLVGVTSEGSVGENKLNGMSFMVNMDFSENKKGFFVSGERNYSEVSVIDNNGEQITHNGTPISFSQVIQY